MEVKTYVIPCLPAGTVPTEVDWTDVPVAGVDTYLWLDGGYEPVTGAQMVFIPGTGFMLRMCCAETDPKAVYESYNQPVYTDSCMEFFAAWVPGDDRYMNMEMNAKGTLLSCLGADRYQRMPVADLTGGALPSVKGTIGRGTWSVTATIPTTLLAAVYGVPADTWQSGVAFRGNFYKCGDETAVPHYGMWNPVGTEKPDFHRPDFFGHFVIA